MFSMRWLHGAWPVAGPSARCIVVAVCAAIWIFDAATAQPLTVKVGSSTVASDAPMFIAIEKGFFTKYGISADFISFVSAANMIAPLAAGDLDVGSGGLSAGLYNAVERGFAIKAVADKVSLPSGSRYFDLLVRKDLVDSGRFKTAGDLKSLRVAEGGVATTTTYALAVMAKRAGISYADFTHPILPFADHIIAMQNQAIDASITVEPYVSRALSAGVATLVTGAGVSETVPNLQIGVLLYSARFSKNTDLAQRFMNAYLEAVRFYAASIKKNHLQGSGADEVVDILTKYTNVKDVAVVRSIAPAEVNPDGRLNIEGMREMLGYFKSAGLVQGNVSVDRLVDTSFVEQSIKTLGAYRPPP
jgi:NitT/TauT family transport system substrate-binding protein